MMKNLLCLSFILLIGSYCMAQPLANEIWLKKYNKDRWIKINTKNKVKLRVNDSTVYKGYLKLLNRWSVQVRSTGKAPYHYDTVLVKDIKKIGYQTNDLKSRGTIAIVAGGIYTTGGSVLIIGGSNQPASFWRDIEILFGEVAVATGLITIGGGIWLRSKFKWKKTSKWEILVR